MEQASQTSRRFPFQGAALVIACLYIRATSTGRIMRRNTMGRQENIGMFWLSESDGSVLCTFGHDALELPLEVAACS